MPAARSPRVGRMGHVAIQPSRSSEELDGLQSSPTARASRVPGFLLGPIQFRFRAEIRAAVRA
eukprot:6054012-Lingulodinium_polyedra.AAC.1